MWFYICIFWTFKSLNKLKFTSKLSSIGNWSVFIGITRCCRCSLMKFRMFLQTNLHYWKILVRISIFSTIIAKFHHKPSISFKDFCKSTAPKVEHMCQKNYNNVWMKLKHPFSVSWSKPFDYLHLNLITSSQLAPWTQWK